MQNTQLTQSDFIEILRGPEIESMVIGTDPRKLRVISRAFNDFKKNVETLVSAWSKTFKTPIDLNSILNIEDSLEFELQQIYIKQEKLDEKLNFVKAEKLLEIIDFPDFSKILISVLRLKGIYSDFLQNDFGLDLLINLVLNISENDIEKELLKASEIKIEGWKNIQKYCSIKMMLFGLNFGVGIFEKEHWDLFPYLVRNDCIEINSIHVEINESNIVKNLSGL